MGLQREESTTFPVQPPELLLELVNEAADGGADGSQVEVGVDADRRPIGGLGRGRQRRQVLQMENGRARLCKVEMKLKCNDASGGRGGHSVRRERASSNVTPMGRCRRVRNNRTFSAEFNSSGGEKQSWWSADLSLTITEHFAHYHFDRKIKEHSCGTLSRSVNSYQRTDRNRTVNTSVCTLDVCSGLFFVFFVTMRLCLASRYPEKKKFKSFKDVFHEREREGERKKNQHFICVNSPGWMQEGDLS